MMYAATFFGGYCAGMMATFVMIYCGTRLRLARMTAPEKIDFEVQNYPIGTSPPFPIPHPKRNRP